MGDTTYKAKICGQEREVRGWTKDRNLILGEGREYTFERLNFQQPGQRPSEPSKEIFDWQLLEVVKLRRENGDWFLNDEQLPLKKWIRLEEQRFYTRRGIPPQYRTLQAQMKAYWHRAKPGELHPQLDCRVLLNSTLGQLPPAVQEQVNGAAWFKHDDGMDGWGTPVLLRSFRPITAAEGPAAIDAKLDALKDSVEKIAGEKDSELRQTKKALGKAQEAAGMNLEEALSMWMHFDPPKMSADTRARTEKAVKMYLTDSDKQSLTKVANEFQVTRQRVSQWFKSFTEQTGFPVVRYKRHESVTSHLKAKQSETLSAKQKSFRNVST